MTKVVFISPHLDDVVLSCGAHIAALVNEAVAVDIVSVFTGAGEEAAPEIAALYETRRNDDIKAAALLGATPVHLGFTDAPFRNKRYYNFSTLLFHHQLPEEELTLVHRIAERLRVLLHAVQPDQVYFPLGVGGHIDHHIVFAAGLLSEGFPVSWYEELPYAQLPGWNMLRLAGIHAVPYEKATDPELPAITLQAVTLPFVKNYITSAEDKEQSSLLLQKEWDGVGGSVKLVSECLLEGAVICKNIWKMPAICLQTKAAAIACYSTEWPVLFGSDVVNIEKWLRAEDAGELYSEAYWYTRG